VLTDQLKVTESSQIEDLIASLTRDLEALTTQNEDRLRSVWANFVEVYAKARQSNDRDLVPYRASQLDTYGQEFLGRVDPEFVKDIDENLAWLLSNQNEILMNVHYPSK
jgi:hypothetical protein